MKKPYVVKQRALQFCSDYATGIDREVSTYDSYYRAIVILEISAYRYYY